MGKELNISEIGQYCPKCHSLKIAEDYIKNSAKCRHCSWKGKLEQLIKHVKKGSDK